MSQSAFRAFRLAGLALAAGAAAGIAAAGDIESSYDAGRIGTARAGAPAQEEPAPKFEAGDAALARAHGFALAAQHDISRPAQCLKVRAEFRSGCEDYVAWGASSGAAVPDFIG